MALVITIVILIILATVTINMAFGEDGLIARAQQAKELTEEATRKEQESLNSLMEEFNEIMSGEGGSGTIPEEPEGPIDAIRGEIQDDTLKVENVPVDSDGDNPEETGTIYVPGGFGIDEESPNDINDGIVITDGTNEFVWIPVSEEKLGEMVNFMSPICSRYVTESSIPQFFILPTFMYMELILPVERGS